jgi:NAD(P)H-dependent flavin oxidoreductase YrpB (nitropropane dioxygenase family)
MTDACRTIRAPLCEMFDVEHPIWLASLGEVSLAPFVAAVSNAGGLTVMGAATLGPEIVEAVRTPVLSAGRIIDGLGVVAVRVLGAQAVGIGTRFIASNGSTAAHSYRPSIVSADDDSIVRSLSYTDKPARSVLNPSIAGWDRAPSRITPFPQQALRSSRAGVMDIGRCILREADGVIEHSIPERHAASTTADA